MKTTTIYAEPLQIGNKLEQFGVTKKELHEVVLAAVAARHQASPLHPITAPGTYSYMEGVAALRYLLLRKDGWEKSVDRGIESVRNKKRQLIILFQNVDQACGNQDPNPISSKGQAVTALVDNPSGYLWDYMANEDAVGENQCVWFLCVSSVGDEVRAELSRPREIEGGNFGTLAERIFIIQDSDWTPEPSDETGRRDSEEEQEYDVPVSKKA